MGAPLTIAHVDTESGFSGGQVQVFLLMEGLAARGVRNVLCCRPGSQEEVRAMARGITVVPVPMANDWHLTAIPRLAAGMVEHGAQLAHLHTGRANWLGGWAARKAGLPAITTRRMDRPITPGWVTRTVYEKLTCRAVAIAPAVADLLRAGGVPEDRIRTICSTVDAADLVPTRGRAELRRELELTDDQVLLLGLARITNRKGFDLLLAALGERMHDPRWVLALGGDGEERGALERQAEALGLADRVRFLGRRDDVPDLLAAADLFVMPSRAEGLGVAALESMAAGTPVLGARVGGLANAVAHEQTGLLVPPEDADALGQALDRLLDDAALRERLGAAGPARIEEGFSARAMVESYLALYHEVLDGP
jgi:glycosyltransferase involved in cell wall biosynthesis